MICDIIFYRVFKPGRWGGAISPVRPRGPNQVSRSNIGAIEMTFSPFDSRAEPRPSVKDGKEGQGYKCRNSSSLSTSLPPSAIISPVTPVDGEVTGCIDFVLEGLGACNEKRVRSANAVTASTTVVVIALPAKFRLGPQELLGAWPGTSSIPLRWIGAQSTRGILISGAYSTLPGGLSWFLEVISLYANWWSSHSLPIGFVGDNFGFWLLYLPQEGHR